MIAAVDLKVSEYEKNQKWLEILNKIENKTYTKLKNGHVFRKQALISKERTLLYDGLVYWKTATGRFKGIGAPADLFFFFHICYSCNRTGFQKEKWSRGGRCTQTPWDVEGSLWDPVVNFTRQMPRIFGGRVLPQAKAFINIL